MAYNAFDEMNSAAGGDMFVTGGSIFSSQYEHDMTPQEQSEYENELKSLFTRAYRKDPLVRQHPVSFNYWLKKQDSEDLEAKAMKHEELVGENVANSTYEPYLVQKLAHLHTGRIEDLIDIVLNLP